MGSERVRAVTVLGLVLVGLGSITGLALGHPPSEPDHGVNETLFPLLWSGDSDGPLSNDSEKQGDALAVHQLAQGTDVPFNRVPDAIPTWNRGELEAFPTSGADTSIRPIGTRVTAGRFIADAHASIFAIQPSTHAHLSPTRQPLYVDESGIVHGVTDYRIELPPDDSTGPRQVSWSLISHESTVTELHTSGRRVSSSASDPTWSLSFKGVAPGTRVLTVVSELSVTVEKHVRREREVCRDIGNRTRCHTAVDHDYTTLEETIAVADETRVTVYDPEIDPTRAVYPDGETRVELQSDTPWLGFEAGGEFVGGVWRFYTARDKGWDRLVRSSSDGSAVIHSPLHPLQVHAVPVDFGSVETAQSVQLLSTDGPSRSRPSLPQSVHLDIVAGPYSGTETMVARLNQSHSTVEVRGLVDGVSTRFALSSIEAVDVNRSNLTLTSHPRDHDTDIARIVLRDAATGNPIDTSRTQGSVLVEGREIQTQADGTATFRLATSTGFLTARYVPGAWTEGRPAYVGDTATVRTAPAAETLHRPVILIAASIGALSVGALFIGRVLGWDLWPLWRGV